MTSISKQDSSNDQVEVMVSILIKGQRDGRDISLVPVGRIIFVYDSINVLFRFKCSCSLEAEKTADRVQEAFDRHAIPTGIAL